jgi:hypothetical protein
MVPGMNRLQTGSELQEIMFAEPIQIFAIILGGIRQPQKDMRQKTWRNLIPSY